MQNKLKNLKKYKWQREYKLKNKEKVAESKRKYYLKYIDVIKKKSKEYYAKNRTKILERQRVYHLNIVNKRPEGVS